MAGIQDKKDSRMMQMTVGMEDTIREELQGSATFRRAYLLESLSCMMNGEVAVGRSMLRKYINGTIGFIALGEALGKSSKTLMQMLGPKGNPQIRNFFEIVAYLQKVEGAVLEVVERSAA